MRSETITVGGFRGDAGVRQQAVGHWADLDAEFVLFAPAAVLLQGAPLTLLKLGRAARYTALRDR
jgi:hypothetical protein